MKLVGTELLKTVDATQTVEGMMKFGWSQAELIEAGYAKLEPDTPDEKVAIDFGVDVPHLLRVEKLASDLLDRADESTADPFNEPALTAYRRAFNALRAEIRRDQAGVQSNDGECA